jgi:hypothetical protein
MLHVEQINMKYPDVEQIKKTISGNLVEIGNKRPDLYFALMGTNLFQGYISNFDEWMIHLRRSTFLKYLASLKSSTFKIKPFGG